MAFFQNLFDSGNKDDKLPDANSRWPPWSWWNEYQKFAEWAAWYSGDPVKLSDVYSQIVDTGDIQGRIWSDDIEDEVRTMLHVPLAGDIASVSADLLFGEGPDIKIPEAKSSDADSDAIETQDRLDEMLEKSDVYSRSVKAAETASALGGCFLKVDWDAKFKQFPILSVAQQDNVLPEFKHGFLRRVLFHRIVEVASADRTSGGPDKDDKPVGTYIRHLEYREPGLIQHGLYEGTRNNLGDRIPLDQHWKTANYEREITHDIDDSLVRYVPNKRPNRLWRTSALGQSDYQGIEGLMDALDATYTSWIRDLKLAKARLLVPKNMIENDDGTLKFDVDKSVYVALEQSPTEEQKITPQQFDIRAEKHKKTAMELFMRAIDSAGYSPQTFGLEESGRAESGTALRLRERKSVQTKNKKERYFSSPLSETLELMLMVDNMKGFSDVTPYRPRIEFGSSFKPSQNELADTLDKINRAETASIETKVRILHPDWSEDEIEEEVEQIKDENGMNVEEPSVEV